MPRVELNYLSLTPAERAPTTPRKLPASRTHELTHSRRQMFARIAEAHEPADDGLPDAPGDASLLAKGFFAVLEVSTAACQADVSTRQHVCADDTLPDCPAHTIASRANHERRPSTATPTIY
ncbi:hypothetical protein MRX96_007063 [Rhipicephalus microplus]